MDKNPEDMWDDDTLNFYSDKDKAFGSMVPSLCRLLLKARARIRELEEKKNIA